MIQKLLTKKLVKKRSKALDSIEWNLLIWCKENYLTFEKEYKFHPVRKWRFDFVVKDLMLAIEYNGIMSHKSRHTSILGYSKDLEKINEAQKLGYTVLQYTVLTYKNLSTDLNNIKKAQ